MWLQPWFFSMLTPHLGQALVFALIHVVFSASLLFFLSHSRTMAQVAGRCASVEQPVQ